MNNTLPVCFKGESVSGQNDTLALLWQSRLLDIYLENGKIYSVGDAKRKTEVGGQRTENGEQKIIDE